MVSMLRVEVAVKAFRAALTTLGKVAPNRFLRHAIVESTEGGVFLSVSIGSARLRVKVPSSFVRQHGAAVLPMEQIGNIARKVKTDFIEIEQQEIPFVDPRCVIRADDVKNRIRARFELPSKPIAELPEQPTYTPESFWTVRGSDLHRALTRCKPAMGDSARYQLDTILIDLSAEHGLSLVSTNRHILARESLTTSTQGEIPDFQPLIPESTVKVLLDLSKGFSEEDFAWSFQAIEKTRTIGGKESTYREYWAHVWFGEGCELSFQLESRGEFPRYRDCLPDLSGATTLTIGVADALKSIKSVAIGCPEDNPGINLSASLDGEGSTQLTLRSPGSRAELTCWFNGPAFEIMLDNRYVLDFLKSLGKSEKTVRVSIPHPTEEGKSAAVCWAVDGTEFLIMPLNPDKPKQAAPTPEPEPEPEPIDAPTPSPEFSGVDPVAVASDLSSLAIAPVCGGAPEPEETPSQSWVNLSVANALECGHILATYDNIRPGQILHHHHENGPFQYRVTSVIPECWAHPLSRTGAELTERRIAIHPAGFWTIAPTELITDRDELRDIQDRFLSLPWVRQHAAGSLGAAFGNASAHDLRTQLFPALRSLLLDALREHEDNGNPPIEVPASEPARPKRKRRTKAEIANARRGENVATAVSSGHDGNIAVDHLRTGDRLALHTDTEATIYTVEITPDGLIDLVSADGRIKLDREDAEVWLPYCTRFPQVGPVPTDPEPTPSPEFSGAVPTPSPEFSGAVPTLRPLTERERNDVVREFALLRKGILTYETTWDRIGKSVADLGGYHRAPARELQRFVRASREHGIDIMPLLRELTEGHKPIIKGRKTLYSREEKSRARRVLATLRGSAVSPPSGDFSGSPAPTESTTAYLSGPIDFGGEPMTRGDVIRTMQEEGTPQPLIDRYLQGADLRERIEQSKAAPDAPESPLSDSPATTSDPSAEHSAGPPCDATTLQTGDLLFAIRGHVEATFVVSGFADDGGALIRESRWGQLGVENQVNDLVRAALTEIHRGNQVVWSKTPLAVSCPPVDEVAAPDIVPAPAVPSIAPELSLTLPYLSGGAPDDDDDPPPSPPSGGGGSTLPAVFETTPLPGFSGPAARRRELYSAWLSGRKATTLRAYQGDAEDFARWAGHADPAAAVEWLFTREQGEANLVALRYRADLTERGLSAATIARRLAALRSLGQLARTLGIVPWELEVSSPRVEGYRDTAGPGANGWARMRQAAASDTSLRGFRDRAIVTLSHDLGLRRSEVAGLDLEHVERDEGRPVAVWIWGKGRTARERLTLPGPTARALADWIDRRGDPPGPLFFRLDNGAAPDATPEERGRLTGQAIADLVERIGRDAGLTRKVRPHGLRHQAITAALDATGGDLRAVSRFSRHASLQTVARYDDNRSDMAGRVAAMVAGE